MTMQRISQNIARATALALILCGGGCSSERKADSSKSGSSQETFATAEAAIDTLIAAARQGDRDRLKGLFGPELDRLSSGSERIDDVDLQLLAAAYDRKHGLADQTADAVTLTVGESEWKFPAPIVKRGNTWQFDTAAGVEEVLNRRIGNNEFDAMRSCLAYVAAQEQYAKTDPDGDHVKDYAPKLMSTPGTRDGLIWPDEMGEPRSFFGPALATARAVGEDRPAENPRGYRGYRFRALDAQGPHASGGAKSFVDPQGHMTGGFALLAWPAIYNETGIMTFQVGREGVIFERDLGPGTAAAADSIQTFDPGTDWVAVVQ